MNIILKLFAFCKFILKPFKVIEEFMTKRCRYNVT